MEGALRRVLICERGALARKQIAVWRGLKAETVLAFSARDVDLELLDEADYAVHHGAQSGWPSPERLVGAAMDAGCDAVDAGPLCDDPEFVEAALRANLAMVGVDPLVAEHYRDPDWLERQAADVGVVASPVGRWPEPEGLRRLVDVWVLVDRRGGRTVLGTIECTVGLGFTRPWLLEMGAVPDPEPRKELEARSLALVREVGSPGVMRVRWGKLDRTGWALRAVTCSIGPGWPLLTELLGFDVSWARVAAWRGAGSLRPDLPEGRHAAVARVVATARGVLESLTLPDGGIVDAESGQTVVPGDILGRVCASGPTRQAALVKLSRTLGLVQVEGVQTGLESLREVCGSQALWQGELDLPGALTALRG